MTGPVLAIDGGPRVRETSYPVWPVLPEEAVEAAARVLRSGRINYWTGEEGRLFEEEFAALCNTRHAIALANGSVALELALYALGIGPGDEVIVTPRSFIASASCAVLRGATPIFADVDPVTGNLTADTIREALTPRTKAVIAVHLAGWPCDMDPIMALADAHGVKVIEDCAQAHGARYKNRPVGSLGHAAAWSFCQDKIITTGGEGGMLTTNDEALWQRAWSFKDHGKDYGTVTTPDPAAVFRWLHHSFGTNWRMTEMQSAIGRVLLTKLPAYVEVRRANAARLGEVLSHWPAIRRAITPPDINHSYYRYHCFVNPEELAPGWSRDRLLKAIVAEGVPCFYGSCSEIYLEEAFTRSSLGPAGRLPNAQRLGETSLMFPVYPSITPQDLADTVEAVAKVLEVIS